MIKFTLVFNCATQAYWFNFPFSYINNNLDAENRTKLLLCEFMKKNPKPKPNNAVFILVPHSCHIK